MLALQLMVSQKPHRWLTSFSGDRYSSLATSRLPKYGYHFNDHGPGISYEYLEVEVSEALSYSSCSFGISMIHHANIVNLRGGVSSGDAVKLLCDRMLYISLSRWLHRILAVDSSMSNIGS